MGMLQRITSAVLQPMMGAWLGGGGSRAYDAGRRDLRDLGSWSPSIATTHEEINVNRDLIVARARELVKNNPTISGAIDRLTEAVMGANAWPESEPNYEALGRTIEWSFTYAVRAEAKFEAWAKDPLRRSDAHRSSLIPEIMRAAYRHWLIDGEACAVIKMKPGRGKYRTCIELIDPDRLSNPNGLADEMKLPNGNKIIGGVEIGRDDDPVAYHIRKAHPASMQSNMDRFTWVRIPRYAASGRQIFIHAFRKDRADQRRGISRLAAIMTESKMAGKYSAAELAAALFDALNVGFIESPAPTSEIRDAMAPTGGSDLDPSYYDGLVDYRKENKIRQEGLSLWHLFPGEKAEITKPARPNTAYPAFMADRDRRVAAGIGLSYPRYANNWADINYSSGKLMGNDEWRGFIEDRILFSQEFGTPIWAAWMEEAVMIGEIKAPGGPSGFYKYFAELTAVTWMGPGPGFGDPKKEAEANEIELRSNTITHGDIAATKGVNPRKQIVKRAFYKRYQEDQGLVDVADTKDPTAAGRPNEAGPEAGDGTDASKGAGQ